MRLVVAVGGNALLERSDIPEAEIQVLHALEAVRALAPLAADHDLVITHGNGPQVGLLAIESTRDPDLTHPFPLDVLGAQTQGMIGYFFLPAFENALPGKEVASLICQTVVSSFDKAFHDPTKFVGSVYTEPEAHRLAKTSAGLSVPMGRTGAGLCRRLNRTRSSSWRRSADCSVVAPWSFATVVVESRWSAARTRSYAAPRRSSIRTSQPHSWPGNSRPTRWCC